jgi:hypothetical protein
MQRMQWTQDQRDDALRLLAEVGKAEAARRTGIPAGTIASWGARLGVTAPSVDAQQAALAAKATSVADRKARLAERMLTEAEAMIGQLHAETVERKPLVVSDGRNEGSHIEIAEVIYDRPPTADQKRIVEAVAILVDKIQLLTGDATARIEQTGDGAAAQPKREQLVNVVDQLAERRRSA